MSVHVTQRAIADYIDRVERIDPGQAEAKIMAAHRGIETAAAFGGHIVKIANGARLILRGRQNVRVVSVYPADAIEGGRHERLPMPRCLQ